MTEAPNGKRNFFVSFNQADRSWATWIAWVLEEAGHSVWFQDWDFRGNFVEHMQRAHREAERTLAVLSESYFSSDFTLSEWSARFAQDPAAREDRLVPVKVGPLVDEGVLRPIVYAELTECDETEAQRLLLERIGKAVDSAYRPKPVTRPGFPGSNKSGSTLVHSGPEAPQAAWPGKLAAELPAQDRKKAQEEGRLMAGARSVSIGREAIGTVIATGNRNRVDARIDVSLIKAALPPPNSVDIGRELAAIRAVLERLGGEQARKIGRALDDAAEEAGKPKPDKDEVGGALSRALKAAQSVSGFAAEIAKLAPHVSSAVGWLGTNWHSLLPTVGLTV